MLKEDRTESFTTEELEEKYRLKFEWKSKIKIESPVIWFDIQSFIDLEHFQQIGKIRYHGNDGFIDNDEHKNINNISSNVDGNVSQDFRQRNQLLANESDSDSSSSDSHTKVKLYLRTFLLKHTTFL